MFSSAVQAPSQLNSDVWERHTVPGARHLQEELAFLKCHSLLGRNIKSGKFPYVAGLWKRCLARTSPNAWVDITLRKYILRVIQMWVGQIMEFFLLLLEANPIFSYFLSPEYFNLVFCLKKKVYSTKKYPDNLHLISALNDVTTLRKNILEKILGSRITTEWVHSASISSSSDEW